MSTVVAAGARQLVVFALGREELAVPISRVREIIRDAAPRPLPEAPPWVDGVIDLRGQVVPVVDLAARLGQTAEGSDDRRIVIVELGDGTVGMTVDGVREVLPVPADAIDPPPPGVAAGYVEGIAKVGDRLIVLIEVETLLAGDGLLSPAGAATAAA